MAKDLPNVRALTGMLLNGVHVAEGEVVAKTAFPAKGDWQNLVFAFTPPRMEETADPVGLPEPAEATETRKLPGTSATR